MRIFKKLLIAGSFVAVAACILLFIISHKQIFVASAAKKQLPLGKEVLSMRDTLIRPNILFHGSPDQNVKILKPRRVAPRIMSEGDVVFATPNIEFATMFMLPHDKKGMRIKGGSFDDGPIYFVCNNKEQFLQLDKGGTIYVVPADSFYYDLGFAGITRKEWFAGKHEEFGRLVEWVSKEPVKPLYKFEFASTLQAMLDLGVQVFFVDEKVYQEIDAALKDNEDPDRRRYLFMKLESENKKRGINYKPLFDYSRYPLKV